MATFKTTLELDTTDILFFSAIMQQSQPVIQARLKPEQKKLWVETYNRVISEILKNCDADSIREFQMANSTIEVVGVFPKRESVLSLNTEEKK